MAPSRWTTALKVSPSFYFDVQVEGAPADLYDTVGQARYYLETDQLGCLVGRGANDTATLASAKTLSFLQLSLTSSATVESIASKAVKPLGTRTEEYELMIPADRSTVTLTANSTYRCSHAIIGTTCPDYVACFDAAPWAPYASEPPAGQPRFALPEVMNYTTSLLVDIANILPSSYISTGGDELNTNCYVNDTLTQMQLNSTNAALNDDLNTFTSTTYGAPIAAGKTPVMWECASAATLSKTRIIQDIEYILFGRKASSA
ncbi:hypothetical protein AZE42_02651 [Rhizopogon vesiculosus]|uniref:beta-N-acetylhexosaminidase n=1 Tax=Rhizopogon vesiculosus TaxID=180088 RepID=A0A1J8Q2W3_9AGAM|nr:hypothetical protein AZE42_02651 [Rhizopogon vesiculosus]